MTSDSRKQPPWISPKSQPNLNLPPLRIYNSLTRTKDDFVPVDPTGKTVTWYACGPTVYEDAHLGHAKNYVSTDIIRRIMKDYFGFRVKFVMNITDIDDKIIVKSRQQYLLARYKQVHAAHDKSLSESILADTKAAFQKYISKNLASPSPDTNTENFAEAVKILKERIGASSHGSDAATAGQNQVVSAADLLLKAHIETARSALEALQNPGSLSEFFAKTDDIMLPHLDDLHCEEMNSDDHGIYLELSKRFEHRFFEDMRSLNVLDPDKLTRVTEYVPQIDDFIKRVMANGFGYAAADSSVYFDIDAFEKAGHSYSRLEPWNKNDCALQADGEGSLSKGGVSVKRNKNDFALWKASKKGEPAWSSDTLGRGRPGWHIECSAMASEKIGETMDIHSGGVDLRFPHHDNELAQSEAYWSTPECKVQWTNYFIHMGQLRIQGLKMSKSLKNYTTIRQALAGKEWSPRSLRICFLLMPWQDGVEVTEELMKAVAFWEDKLNNFFLNTLDLWKQYDPKTTVQTQASISDQQFSSVLDKATADVHTALCDSFNTSSVMRIVSDLITHSNSTEGLSKQTVIRIARWVTRIVTIFGLDPEGDLSDLDRIGWSGIDIPEPAKPYVYPVSQLRDKIRVMAVSGSVDHAAIARLADEAVTAMPMPAAETSKPYHQVLQQFHDDIKVLTVQKSSAKDVLALCDQLRDVHLWTLGIYLEDRNNNQSALVRPLDKQLIEARAEKESAGAAKARTKLEQEARSAERDRDLRERVKLRPQLMFRNLEEYSSWDENGIPILDAAGSMVSKNKRKKLIKEWEKQKERYERWLSLGEAV